MKESQHLEWKIYQRDKGSGGKNKQILEMKS
jgi:hypothetical protein